MKRTPSASSTSSTPKISHVAQRNDEISDSSNNGSLHGSSFEDHSNAILTALATATAKSQFLATKDLPFYKTSSKVVNSNLKSASSSILSIVNRLVKISTSQSIDPLLGLDDVVDRFDSVVEVIDNLLEKVVSNTYNVIIGQIILIFDNSERMYAWMK